MRALKNGGNLANVSSRLSSVHIYAHSDVGLNLACLIPDGMEDSSGKASE
jgi:hypothetical protein